MPRIADFNGVVIEMYFRDHAPPHVHAFHGDDEALIAIRTQEVLEGSLPSKPLRLAREWIAARVEELLAKWTEFGGG